MSSCMLTGRPEEEMSESSGDLLQELSQMHERARQAMRRVAKALMAIRFPSRKHGGACTTIYGSVAAFPIMEDIGLPRRYARGLGHGENTVYQA